MKKATVTWDEAELADGYNLYLDSGVGFVKLNTEMIVGTTYEFGVEDGNYDLYVTSLTNGNESLPSVVVDVVVQTLPSYKIFRLDVLGTEYTANDYKGSCQFGLFGSVGDPLSDTLPLHHSGVARASSYYLNYYPENAFDGDLSTRWVVNERYPWVEYEFDEPQSIAEFGVGSYQGSGGGGEDRSPKDIEVLGYNDDTGWDILFKAVLSNWTSEQVFRRFEIEY